MVNNININTEHFLDAVINPINSTKSAQVPDTACNNSLCLTDTCDQINPSLGTSLDYINTYSGCAFVFLPGMSVLKTTYATNPSQHYHIAAFPINSTTNVLERNAVSNKYAAFGFTNIGTITGNGSSYDLDDCTVDAYRLFAFGMRMLAEKEFVTSDATNAFITQFYGFEATPNSIYRCIVDAANVYNMSRNSDSIKTFAVNEGVSVRMNPFYGKDFLDYKSLTQWSDTNWDYSDLKLPVIMARFSSNVAITAFPGFNFYARLFIEGQLSLPTPLYAQPSPVDINYHHIYALMSQNNDDLPVVVKGHTFPQLNRRHIALLKQAFVKASQVASFAMTPSTTNLNNIFGVEQPKRQKRKANRSNANVNRKIAQVRQMVKSGAAPRKIRPAARNVPNVPAMNTRRVRKYIEY